MKKLLLILFQCYAASIFSGCTHSSSPGEDPTSVSNSFCLYSVSDKVVQLFWSGNASKYYIQRKTLNDTSFQEIGSTTDQYYFDYYVDSSKSYYYRIKASRSSETVISQPFQISYVPSNKLLRIINNNYPINKIILSPDGHYISYLDDELSVNIINTTIWSINRYSNNKKSCWLFAFTSNSQAIYTGELSYLKIRSVQDGTIIQSLNTDSTWIYSLAFTREGQKLVSNETKRDKHYLKLWDLSTGTAIKILDSTTEYSNDIVSRPDSNILYTCSYQGLRVWDITQQKQIYQNSLNCYSPVINYDGLILAVHTGDYFSTKKIYYYNTTDFSLKYVISIPSGSSMHLIAFSPDGNLQLIGNNNQVVIAKLSDGTILHNIFAHIGYVVGGSFFPDSKMFTTASYDGTIKVWSIEQVRQWTIVQ
jgi:hypothetical protein